MSFSSVVVETTLAVVGDNLLSVFTEEVWTSVEGWEPHL